MNYKCCVSEALWEVKRQYERYESTSTSFPLESVTRSLCMIAPSDDTWTPTSIFSSTNVLYLASLSRFEMLQKPSEQRLLCKPDFSTPLHSTAKFVRQSLQWWPCIIHCNPYLSELSIQWLDKVSEIAQSLSLPSECSHTQNFSQYTIKFRAAILCQHVCLLRQWVLSLVEY